MEPRKIILENSLSPGDIVMLTAAVRDLHAHHPGKFLTDARTSARDLWKHNPHLTRLKKGDADVEVIRCHYPLIHKSNQQPYHFIHGFQQFLSKQLDVAITPTAFKGDIHLSEEEKSARPQVEEVTGSDAPYWVVVAGGKMDFTIKWWSTDRFQQVVNHFRGRIRFVQVGESGHHHPALDGVIDLRGRTNIRQLIQLIHHAQGVLSPVTFAMHLAAAIETAPGAPAARPCVVVAGGREPVHWEAYPHHRYLHTQGALSCCQTGGCWKGRTVPLGDGDSKDKPKNLCVDVAPSQLPRCMDMITPAKVIEAIESYFDGGLISYLKEEPLPQTVAREAPGKPDPPGGNNGAKNNGKAARNRLTLRLLGLRRSGIHPILNWIAGLYEGRICFINDINHQPRIRPNHPCDKLPSIRKSRLTPVRLNEQKDLLLLAYEDERLVELKSHSPDRKLYGSSAEFRDILVLRDPFNTFASRLQLLRARPRNAFVRNFLLPDEKGTPHLTNRWKFLAHEFLGRTDHLSNNKLLINFNRWVTNEAYRRELCDLLGVPFRDDHREAVTQYGFGSSFDNCRFDRNGSSMKLAERWTHFRDDPEYLDLISDSEILELSQTIFGADFDHAPIRQLLDRAPNLRI